MAMRLRCTIRRTQPNNGLMGQMRWASEEIPMTIPRKPKNETYDPYWEESVYGNKPRTMSGGRATVTLVPGLGAGEEHMGALQDVFTCAGAPVDFEIIREPYNNEDAFKNMILSIQRNGLAIKGNIEQRKRNILEAGLSLNMLTRKLLDLYVSVYQFKSYDQLRERIKIASDFNVVLMRQNTEGEYSMLEHQPLSNIVEHLRIVTRANSTRLSKYAFEYAVKRNRKKVTLVSNKDIVPVSEAIFIKSFLEIAKKYPSIEAEEMDITSFTQRVLTNTSKIDVVLSNSMLGSILASMFCGFLGSPELVPSKNLGPRMVLYETASWRRFQEYSRIEDNPMSTFISGIGILEEIGAFDTARAIKDSLEETLSERVWTRDLGGTATVEEFTVFLINCIKTKVRNIQCNFDSVPSPPKLKKMVEPFTPDKLPGMTPPEPNYKKFPPNEDPSTKGKETDNGGNSETK